MNKKIHFLAFNILSLVFASLACMETATPLADLPTDSESEVSPVSPEPAETVSTTDPSGFARNNPASPGSEVTLNDLTFTVVEVVRPADDIVTAGGASNPSADPDKEFILVTIAAACNKTVNETCKVSADFDFNVIGTLDVAYDPKNFFISGVADLLESDDIPGGTSVTGGIIFEINKDDAHLVLVYEPYFETAVYLALE